MFVHYETEVPIAMSEVEQALQSLRSDLGSMADVAYREGEDLRARVGPGSGAIAKEVKLYIGPAEIHRTGLFYPLHWSAVGSEVLFPHLIADLVVSHIGPERTKIAIDGIYQPPLGKFGIAVDRILLRRVAESTVEAWMNRLAESLTGDRAVS
jgi:hypothetical protein